MLETEGRKTDYILPGQKRERGTLAVNVVYKLAELL